MFEQIKNGDDGISLDAPTVCFVLAWIPFIIAWAYYNTVLSEWLVQTYFITIMLFINYPRQYARKSLSKAWFRKAMILSFVVMHPAILSLMWFVDVSTKTQWHASRTMLSICAVSFILEATLLLRIVKAFQPVAENASGSAKVN